MKKLICVLLSAVMLSATLCSCSANNNDKADIQLKFTYDSIYEGFDSSVVRAYETMCNAVINGDSEAGINTGLLEQANQLFYTSFPLSVLVSDIEPNDDRSGVSIKYNYEPDEHAEKVKAFSDKVNAIISECREGTLSEMDYVVKLYNYVLMHAVFDNSLTSTTVYSTIMEDRGSVYTYTGMFEYLLRQNGIKAIHIIASGHDGSSWALSGAQIGDNFYYFDLGTEYSLTSGKLLRFFGLTTQDVSNRGFEELLCTNGATPPDASDLKFDPCRNCMEWSLENGNLLVTTPDGTVVEISQN